MSCWFNFIIIYFQNLEDYYWNTTFLQLSLITEGATEKVSQFILSLRSVYNKNECFNEQKCQKLKNNFIFTFLSCPVYLFRGALYELILELRIDLPFNYLPKMRFCEILHFSIFITNPLTVILSKGGALSWMLSKQFGLPFDV